MVKVTAKKYQKKIFFFDSKNHFSFWLSAVFIDGSFCNKSGILNLGPHNLRSSKLELIQRIQKRIGQTEVVVKIYIWTSDRSDDWRRWIHRWIQSKLKIETFFFDVQKYQKKIESKMNFFFDDIITDNKKIK